VNFLLFLFLILPIVFIVMNLVLGHRSIMRMIFPLIGFMVVMMVGWQVLTSVFEALPESSQFNNSLTYSMFGEKECVTGEYIPSSDIEMKCKGKTGSISVQSCDKTGRICTSKSVDCSKINSDGKSGVGQKCSGMFSSPFVLIAITMGVIVMIMTMFNGIHRMI